MSARFTPTARAEALRDRVSAAVIVVVVAVVVGLSAQSLGFVRDEGYYFKAGTQYAGFWRALFSQPMSALSSTSIDQHLSYNPEHPFLLKGLFGLSWLVNDVLGSPVLQSNALRAPAWIVSGLAALFVFLLARRLLPWRGAVVAVALFVSMPHVFWHMHLACFDVGVVGAHAALVWAYLRFRHTVRGAAVVGVVFGIAGAVKHNVLPMPALLVLHFLVCEFDWRELRLRIPLVFLSLAFIAPPVYVLLWPYLWPDVTTRFGQYIAFHLHHEHYPILYFGDLLTHPPFPWLFPIVMWAVTIPAPVLALIAAGVGLAGVSVVSFLRARVGGAADGAVVGAVDGAAVGAVLDVDGECTRVALGGGVRGASGSNALLLLLNAALPVFLIALPSTPIFGGTKHWMNALPFLCVLAAWAVLELAARVAHSLPRVARRDGVAVVVVVVVAAVAVAPGVARTLAVWPYGLGSYNDVIGFERGAATVGMQRTFWGYETRSSLPLINARTPPGGRIHFGDVNADSHRMYVADGLLRKDIAYSGSVRGSAVAHVEPQGEFKQQQMDVWNEWGRAAEVHVVAVDGVPVSTVTFR